MMRLLGFLLDKLNRKAAGILSKKEDRQWRLAAKDVERGYVHALTTVELKNYCNLNEKKEPHTRYLKNPVSIVRAGR
jgi:hypothetical protein